jgi:hypothetical protein
MKPFPIQPVACAVASLITATCLATTGTNGLHRPVLNVWLENDLMVRTDQHYTHGSRIA